MPTTANEWLLFSGKITTFFMLLPITIAIWKWQRLNNILKVFFIFCLVSFLMNALELLFVWLANNHYFNFQNIKNTNFGHIYYTLKNYIVLGWFYVLIFKPYTVNKWVLPSVLLLILASLMDYFFFESKDVASGFSYVASSVFCWLPPMVLMRNIFNEDSKVPLTRNPYFWVCLGLIVANLPSFLLTFIANKIYQTDYVLYVTLYCIKNVFSIIGIVFRTIGFWYARYVRFLPQ